MARLISPGPQEKLLVVWNVARMRVSIGSKILAPSPSGRVTVLREEFAEIFVSSSKFARTIATGMNQGRLAVAVVNRAPARLPLRFSTTALKRLSAVQFEELCGLRAKPEPAPAPAPAPKPAPVEVSLSDNLSFEDVVAATAPVPSVEVVDPVPVVPEPEPVLEVSTEGTEITVADQDLYDTIPWDKLEADPSGSFAKMKELRQWGSAFEPAINGVSKKEIAGELLATRI